MCSIISRTKIRKVNGSKWKCTLGKKNERIVLQIRKIKKYTTTCQINRIRQIKIISFNCQ